MAKKKRPRRQKTVYAIFGLNYDECDGYMFADYDFLASDIFESKEECAIECAQMIEDFYAHEDPQKFANPDIFGGTHEDVWTWDEIRVQPQWHDPFEPRTLTLKLEKPPCRKKK